MTASHDLILGLNVDHPDSAAALVAGGRILAAVEEERFTRAKHWVGLPTAAIRACLETAGCSLDDVRHLAVNTDPSRRRASRLRFLATTPASWPLVPARLRARGARTALDERLALAFDRSTSFFAERLRPVEHHRAHLASAWYPSPFEEAAVVSVDGAGDFATTLRGLGRGQRLTTGRANHFPHGLGFFYLALTQHLGFPHYGDEYKVMGLAASGEPHMLPLMHRLMSVDDRGQIQLDLRYFRHHRENLWSVDEHGRPVFGRHASKRMDALLGPARRPSEPLTQRHRDLAASVQAAYEGALFRLLRSVARETGQRQLALAGGCAQNSLANGKIADETPFQELWVAPASGDAGGALGAALDVAHHELGAPRVQHPEDAAFGPEVRDLDAAMRRHQEDLERHGIRTLQLDSDAMIAWTADRLSRGKVVGWVQGRMEWGPRALGQRSILADPRGPEVAERLNLRVKRREAFRPFAPVILSERLEEWFETRGSHPFMAQVVQARERTRRLTPAIVHEDGTSRVQTVAPDGPSALRGLLEAFEGLTGVPVLLNTSFNEQEPVVASAHDALSCFLRTRIDALVIGGRVFERPTVAREPLTQATSIRASGAM